MMTDKNLLLSVMCLAVGVVQAFYIDYDTSFFPEEFGSSAGGSVGFTDGIQKRYGFSAACRSCMFRRDDWRSCTMCYGRPGHVPFYGGFSKRSGIAPGEQEVSPSWGEQTYPLFHAASKRASSGSCRCCVATYDRRCCQQCYYIPYYSPVSKRSSSADLCDECCSEESFDLFCCAQCAK